MEKYHLVKGSASCFSKENFSFAICDKENDKMFDVAMTGLLTGLLFIAVSGNWLVNGIFRVYNVVRKESSVSHLCLSHMALSDLIYSIMVTPLTLAVFMSGNRFALDSDKDGVLTNPVIQIVGFTSEVTRRASILFLTIVAVDQTVFFYLPSFHKAHFSLVSIKTALGSCWVGSVVFGILPFMSNSKYELVMEMVAPQWDIMSVYVEESGGDVSRAAIFEKHKRQLIWTFVIVEVIPILLPAAFLLVSNIVLTLKMDLKKRRDINTSEEESPAKKKYDPFSLKTREFAMRIANNLGDIPVMSHSGKSKNRNRMVNTHLTTSLNSLRPITSVYILCNLLQIVSIGNKWMHLDSEHPYRIFKDNHHLHVINLVLMQVSVALTPVLHFLCSRQMRLGLEVMMGGYVSASQFRSNQGLRKKAISG